MKIATLVLGLLSIFTLNATAEDTQCDNSPGWHDSDGPQFDCEWYGQKDNCWYYGYSYENQEMTAQDACCVCGGGVRPVPPSSAPTSPTCVDSPLGWYDSYGPSFGCSYYATGYCESEGDDYENEGKTANQACCVCGGGIPIEDFKDPLVNYEFYPQYDSWFGDISQIWWSQDVRFFAQECDADPTCLGFNSNGWLKHTIKNQSNWTFVYYFTEDQGLYVKTNMTDTTSNSSSFPSFGRLLAEKLLNYFQKVDENEQLDWQK